MVNSQRLQLYEILGIPGVGRTTFASSFIFLAQVFMRIAHLDSGIFVHSIPAFLKLHQKYWDLQFLCNSTDLLNYVWIESLVESLFRTFIFWGLSPSTVNWIQILFPSPVIMQTKACSLQGGFLLLFFLSVRFVLFPSSEKNPQSMMLSALLHECFYSHMLY